MFAACPGNTAVAGFLSDALPARALAFEPGTGLMLRDFHHIFVLSPAVTGLPVLQAMISTCF